MNYSRDGQTESGTEGDFRERLHRLKQTGCNLLVVGTHVDALTQVSEQLMGGSGVQRHQLLALSNASELFTPDRLNSTAENAVVFDCGLSTRSATATTSPSVDGHPQLRGDQTSTVERIAVSNLGQLESEIAAKAILFEQESSLQPSELRVGIDALGPFFDEYNDQDMLSTLRIIQNTVSRHHGMGHYVLAKPYKSQQVQWLTSQLSFEGIVEVRQAKTGAYVQRWHLDDYTTPWLEITKR